MTVENVLIVSVLAVLAFAVSLLLYKPKQYPLLYLLRSLALFFLLLFLWNPTFVRYKETGIKPELIILSDYTKSVAPYFELTDNMVSDLSKDKKLNDRFNIKTYYFTGKLLKNKPGQPGQQTDIYKILRETEQIIDRAGQTAIILITDGNHTIGNQYTGVFQTEPKIKVFPVVIGDTTRYVNTKIERTDYNESVSKGNFFFIKTLLTSENIKEEIKTNFTVKKNGRVIFSEKIVFTPAKNFHKTEIKLQEKIPGIHTYELFLKPIEGERKTKDNYKKIRIRVSEHKADILILTGKVHPDAGVFNRILSRNKAYNIRIKKTLPANKVYDLIIAVQPDRHIAMQLKNTKTPVFWITGKHTDWQALNGNALFERKTSGKLYEEYFAYENPAFTLFGLKDLPGDILPPLTDYFGKLTLKQPAEVIYFARVKNQRTGQPLMVIFPGQKQAAVFGQGLWRWYMYEKRFGNTGHMEDLINKTVDFLMSESGSNRLQVAYEKSYAESKPVRIGISAYNTLMEPNPKAQLKFRLTRSDGKTVNIPVYYSAPFFTADLGILPSGNYKFTVVYPEYHISKEGYFEVKPVDPEQTETADVEALQSLAGNTKGKLFFPGEIKDLKEHLLNSSFFKVIIRQEKKESPLTSRYLWLFLFVFILSVEWFIRKYRGML
jgi:hypothetical protein